MDTNAIYCYIKKFSNLVDRQRNRRFREKGFLFADMDLYSSLLPTIHNIRYYWFLMGLSEALNKPNLSEIFQTKLIFTKVFIKTSNPRSKDVVYELWPTTKVDARLSVDINIVERRYRTDWITTEEYRISKIESPETFYDLTDKELIDRGINLQQDVPDISHNQILDF